MNSRTPAKKRPGLGTALAASLEGERGHIDQRFAKAEAIFGDKPSEQALASPGTPAPEGGSARPPVAPPADPPVPVEDAKVERIGFSLLKKESRQLDAMFAGAVREAPRTTTSEVIRAALAVFARMSSEERLGEIRKLEKPKLRRRRE